VANESVPERWASAWSSHDIEAALALFSDDCVYEDVARGVVNHGKEELRSFAQGFVFVFVSPRPEGSGDVALRVGKRGPRGVGLLRHATG
jgi:uncharacterized protein (TIGR02246 family)